MKTKKSTQFIILTCALSWVIAGVAILLGLRIENATAYTIFAMGYMFLPAICALILQKAHGEKLFSNLGVSFRLNRWCLIAGLAPLAYTLITIGVNILFPGVSFSANYEGFLAQMPAEQAELMKEQLSQFPPLVFVLINILNAFIAAYTINAVFAFGEELGWRGYLLKALSDKKMLPMSLIIGVVWGLWHFPLILLGHNYPEHSVLGVGMMVIYCTLVTPMMIYITIKAKTVLAAAFFHGMNNALAGLPLLFLVGGNDLTNGVTGLAGFVAIIITTLAFFAYDRYVTKENLFA